MFLMSKYYTYNNSILVLFFSFYLSLKVNSCMYLQKELYYFIYLFKHLVYCNQLLHIYKILNAVNLKWQLDTFSDLK